MTKNNWIVSIMSVVFVALVQFSIHRIFEVNCWNKYTLLVYSVVFGITFLALPLLKRLKFKDQQLFVQGFMAFTVIQMLILMTLVLVAVFKFRENAVNFSFQLIAIFFTALAIQTIVLLSSKK